MDGWAWGRGALAAAVACGLLAVMLTVAWSLRRRHWFSVWIKRPFQMLAFCLAFWLFSRAGGFRTLQPYALAIVVAAAVGGLVHVGVSFVFTVFFSRRRAIHLPPLLRNVIVAGTYILVLVVALKATVPDFSLSPLLVASGVLSLVIGLAFQDVLSNLISGVTLSVEKPLRKDDWVEIDGREGKVVEVTWRTTKIRTRCNDYVIFPNRIVAERALVNYNYPSRAHLHRIEIGLPYTALPSTAEELLLEAAERVDGILPRPRPVVLLNKYDEYAVIYWLIVWLDDYERLWRITSAVHREIFYSLKRYGIAVPFPTRLTKHVTQEPPPSDWMRPYRYRLEVTEGPRRGDLLPLGEGAVQIGRGEECEIDLRDPTASKQHARIARAEDGYIIEDAGSKHGTLVNGERTERTRLRTGDEIQLGETTLRFEEITLG